MADDAALLLGLFFGSARSRLVECLESDARGCHPVDGAGNEGNVLVELLRRNVRLESNLQRSTVSECPIQR